METRNELTPTNRRFLTSKVVFTVTLIVAVLTILSIWLFGLGQQRTLFENSILSTTVLAIGFFLFLTIGLYNGVKLKDDLGNLTDKISISDFPSMFPAGKNVEFSDLDDGVGGIIVSIVLWIVVTIAIGLFLWFFGTLVWSGILVFIAMLYWIFFRAVRLVFKNSNRCKGDLTASAGYGLLYTALYSCWVYGIILGAHYLIK